MREFTQLKTAHGPTNHAPEKLILSYEQRQKSRLCAELADGEKIGVLLPHGKRLIPGAILVGSDGSEIEVAAAKEQVTTITSSDHWQLIRAAYHLGNRHVPIEIGSGWLRYEPDHVLDEMLIGLGFTPETELAPFNPEAGAYASHGHHHHEHD